MAQVKLWTEPRVKAYEMGEDITMIFLVTLGSSFVRSVAVVFQTCRNSFRILRGAGRPNHIIDSARAHATDERRDDTQRTLATWGGGLCGREDLPTR